MAIQGITDISKGGLGSKAPAPRKNQIETPADDDAAKVHLREKKSSDLDSSIEGNQKIQSDKEKNAY